MFKAEIPLEHMKKILIEHFNFQAGDEDPDRYVCYIMDQACGAKDTNKNLAIILQEKVRGV